MMKEGEGQSSIVSSTTLPVVTKNLDELNLNTNGSDTASKNCINVAVDGVTLNNNTSCSNNINNNHSNKKGVESGVDELVNDANKNHLIQSTPNSTSPVVRRSMEKGSSSESKNEGNGTRNKTNVTSTSATESNGSGSRSKLTESSNSSKKPGSGPTGGARAKTGQPVTSHRPTRSGSLNMVQNPPRGGNVEFPLRIIVSSEMVGAIIGKAGGTIKSITQETRARVDVMRKDNAGSSEKVIAIYGNPENCSKACHKILQVMMDETKSSNDGRSDELLPLKLLAHNTLVGRIIGKAGATIKKIMESTNTKISVSNEDPNSMFMVERVITIRGNSIEDIMKAETAISSKLRQCFETDLMSSSMMYPPAIIPPGHYLPQHGHHLQRGPPQPMRHAPVYGPPAFMPPMHVAPNLPFASHVFPGSPPFGHTSHGPGPWTPEDVKETAVIYVPQAAVGAIIGTGGATIREMITSSGAQIKVAQPPKEKTKNRSEEGEDQNERKSSSPDVDVSGLAASLLVDHRRATITGSPESQWKAQYLIFRKIGMDSANGGPEPHLVVEIMVPSNQVGRIIGKSGQTVRELQRMTRAQIKLPEEGTTTGAETPVQITGDFFACQSAQRHIRSLVSRNLVSGHEQHLGGETRPLKKSAPRVGHNTSTAPKVESESKGSGAGAVTPSDE